MATPRRSVVLVVLGVLAAAAAGSYYFFFVYTHDEELQEARQQIEQWELRWREARACLLGASPRAADLGDAVSARELWAAHVEGTSHDCARELGRLVRPEGNASPLDGVEVAWEQVEEAGKELAARYLSHRDASARRAESLPALVSAIERLRKARATLRRVAELSMEDGPMGPSLRVLEATPLVLDAQPVTELAGVGVGAELVGRFSAAGRWYHGRLRKAGVGFEVVARALSSDVVPSLPDATWGIAAAFDAKDPSLMRLSAGPLDEAGALSSAVELASSRPSLLPAAALGAGPQRLALYVVANDQVSELRTSQSADGGKTWRSAAQPWAAGNVFVDGVGAADVVYQSAPPAAVVWQRATATGLPALPAPARWEGQTLVASCPAASAPWVLARPDGEAAALALARLDRLQAPIAVADEGMSTLLDCDDRAALLGDPGSGRVLACEGAVCKPLLSEAREGMGVVVAGKPMYAMVHRSLLAVFVVSDEPRLVKLPDGTTLQGVYAVGDSLLVVLRSGAGVLSAALAPS